MKTKFYKRLVPLALIASMAVTNVGITSASANTPVAIEQTTGMDAPVVGASIPAEANVVFASEDAATGTVEITINEPNETWSGNDNFKLYLSDTDETGIVSNSYSDSKIIFEVPKSAFENGDSIETASVAYTGGREVQVGTGNITLKKTIKQDSSDNEDDSAVSLSDGFQIPAGMVYNSKTKVATGYAVGITKVQGGEATTEDGLLTKSSDIQASQIAESAKIDNVSVENPTALEGKYVVWYNTSGKFDKATNKYVKVLNTDEQAKLPKAVFKAEATLTEAEKATLNEKVFTELNKYFIDNDGAFAGTDTAAAANGNLFKATNEVVYTAVEANASTGTYEVKSVPAASKALVQDSDFMEAVKKAYNEANSTKLAFDETYIGNKKGEDGEEITAETALVTVNAETKEVTGYTDAGYKAIINIFAKDLESYKTYLENNEQYKTIILSETNKYLNELNAAILNADPDLSLVQWTMETLSGDKGTDAKGKEVYTRTNGNAKFFGKSLSKVTDKKTKVVSWKAAEKDSTCARVAGASTFITATKAAKKFNNTVYLKAVKDAYVTPTAKTEAQAANVIFTEQFFVTPALPTAFNPNKLEGVGKDDTAKLSKADGWEDSDSKRNYTLTLDVGKSLKLPFALKDGVEKDLVYEVGEDSNGFNVVNGKVTATDAGSGTIKVYSRALGREKLYADVNVTVNPAVKSVVANTKSISVWPGSSQVITLGTNPASNPGSVNTETNTFTPGDFKYKITAPAGVTVKYKKWQIVDAGEAGTADDDVYGWGDAALESGGFALSDMIVVEPAAEGTIEKNSVIKVELYKGDAKVSFKKDFEIKVNATTAPQDVKSIKATAKVKKDTEGFKHISIPVGGSVNLGCAVTPATANATIDSKSEDADVATVCGDVVTGVGEGSTTVTLTPQGKIADGFKSNITNDENKVVYTIDVYEPGDSILFDDNSDLTIKGGFLMTKAAAATDCNKSFPAGVAIDMPFTNEHGEEITWKCNNPAAIGIDTDQDKFIPSIPGTYTITGTTPYTKQKLAFKINVVAENKADDITDTVKSAAQLAFSDNGVVGRKINAFMSVPNTTTGGIGGTVEFESSKPEVATISKKNGAIVCKSKGTTKITAKMTCGSTTITAEADLEVYAKNVTIKTNKVAAGAIKDEDFAVAVAFNNFDKKTMKLVWTAKDSNNADATSKLSGLSEDKLSGKAKFNAVGTYKIFVAVKSGEDPVMDATEVGTVNVYENAVKAANVNNADADTKKAIAALGGKNDPAKENTKFNGAGNKQTYYVPVFVTPKADDKPVPAATADDVTFNISNKSLAKAEFIPKNDYAAKEITAAALNTQENDIVKDYEKAYGLIKIETAPEAEANKISGVVTVKAILKNSNKTVSVKLNVLNKSLTAQIAYAPQSVAELANGVNLAAVVDAGATDAKPMYDNTEKVKAIANSKTKDNATFKVWKYVLVNDSNVKNVNKAQATKMIDTAAVTVGSANQTTGLSNVKFTFPDGVTAPTDGTWYLALAESTIKVTKKAVKADANATPAVQAADAEYSQSAITVKKIASKTPITKIATTTGDDTSGDDDNTNTGNNNG